MAFDDDLAVGQSVEQMFGRLLGDITNWSNGSSRREELTQWDWAARIDNKVVKFEVKYDIYESKSGNVAFEFYNPRLGKASGVDATTADIWVHVLSCPTTVWVCSVAKLRRHIQTVAPWRTIACGGDGNAAMRLYRRESLFAVLFIRIDNLSSDELLEVLREVMK